MTLREILHLNPFFMTLSKVLILFTILAKIKKKKKNSESEIHLGWNKTHYSVIFNQTSCSGLPRWSSD